MPITGHLSLPEATSKTTDKRPLTLGSTDLIAIGRPFISNPDLVERLRNDWPLAELDRTTIYDGGNKGYVDYPLFECAHLTGGVRL